VQEKLREFGWEILSGSLYSLDIAPSDYHLFRALQQLLVDNKFNSNVEKYFSEKRTKIYSGRIRNFIANYILS
ncbi:hypothetical protein WH47_05398, partial [Habropoda laboriosa]